MRGSAAFRAAVAPGGVLAGPWVKNELWRRARAVPSLDLRFADNKSLTDAVTGQSLVTFTRASSGTYVGSDGLIKTAMTDEPRFDHNPTTGESLGLLVEEQRTNLALNTVLAGGTTPTSWSLGSTGVPTVVSSVYGNADGSTALSFATNANRNHITQTVALAANTTYVFSVLVESVVNYAGTNANVISLNNPPAGSTITAAPGNPAVGQRITATVAVDATAGNVQIRIGLGVGSNATGTIILSRPQLEAGAFPTSYIPTTTAAATRSADVASITGANFSSWYRQDEGTVFVNAINPAASTTLYAASDGTTNNRIQADTGTNTRVARVVTGGTTQANNTIAYTFGAQQQFALSYVLNSINFANAGTLGTEDTSATIPTVDQLRIGANSTGANALNSTIRRLTYWPQRLSNSTLQAVTQ